MFFIVKKNLHLSDFQIFWPNWKKSLLQIRKVCPAIISGIRILKKAGYPVHLEYCWYSPSFSLPTALLDVGQWNVTGECLLLVALRLQPSLQETAEQSLGGEGVAVLRLEPAHRMSHLGRAQFSGLFRRWFFGLCQSTWRLRESKTVLERYISPFIGNYSYSILTNVVFPNFIIFRYIIHSQSKT